MLPTGQLLTPTAAPGAVFERLATGFFTTSGQPIEFNVPDPLTGRASATTTANAQWLFVYDVTGPVPIVRQRINVPNTFCGLSWLDSRHFVVSGGADDRVYLFAATGSDAAAAAGQTYRLDTPEFLLGHNSAATAPIPNYDGGLLNGTVAGGPRGQGQYLTYGFGAIAAGVAASRDGRTVFVANLQNDSLSIADAAARRTIREVRFFRPGGTAAIGEYPFGIAVLSSPGGAARKVYVSSLRDGQILRVDPATGAFSAIAVGGEPNTLLLSPDGAHLYVANGDDDSIDVIDTARDVLERTISMLRPGYPFKGANPNGLALSPDGRTLYVTLGGENALAVVDLASGSVRGRIPTGWEPSSVTVSPDGTRLFVVNTRSNAGPSNYFVDQQDNPIPQPLGFNGYVYALEKAGLLSLPVPEPSTLASLSALVDRNNGFGVEPLGLNDANAVPMDDAFGRTIDFARASLARLVGGADESIRLSRTRPAEHQAIQSRLVARPNGRVARIPQ